MTDQERLVAGVLRGIVTPGWFALGRLSHEVGGDQVFQHRTQEIIRVWVAEGVLVSRRRVLDTDPVALTVRVVPSELAELWPDVAPVGRSTCKPYASLEPKG